MRRTGGRLLAALLLAVAGIAAAALLAPRGAAAPQSPCSSDTTAAGESDACATESTPTVTTPEPPPPTTTTPTPTTPTPPSAEPPPPMPTVTIPDAGIGTVEQPTGTIETAPSSTPEKQTKPHATPAVPAPVRHLGPTKATPKLGAGTYIFPVYGPASYWDTYGDRTGTGWHHGDDVFAPFGAPVLAVADGTLFLVGWNQVGGNRLWLRDDAGNYFYYAHLAAFSTAAVEGGRVKAGTVLGFVGDSGDARGTPPHLHFEIHPSGMIPLGYDAAVNPTGYLRAWQRRQRLHFTNSDLIFATVSGWSAVVAAPRAAPGAILLHSDDISSATSLDRGSVAKALAPPPVHRRPWALRQALAQRKKPKAVPLIKLSPSERSQAVKAESLDQGAALPPGFPGMSIWDTLSQCEAGGDWTANTGNGFFGGLQFTQSTWVENGGGRFAKAANFASREQQISIAERVLATQGWIAWPACSAKLGLR